MKVEDHKTGCLIALVAIPVAVVVLFVAHVAWQIFQYNVIREPVTFIVPGTSFELKHSRIGINPIVAEYERNIAFVVNGQESRVFPLMIDTCGGYPINCYLIETPDITALRLDDAVSEHLIDLTNQSVFAITRAMGESYYGKIDESDSSSGWSMANDDPSTLKVTIGGRRAKRLSDLLDDCTETYVGRIDGKAGRLRFIPATESPEIEIDHLFDR
jgi:hypothetical protein